MDGAIVRGHGTFAVGGTLEEAYVAILMEILLYFKETEGTIMEVKILFTSSKDIHPKFGNIIIGKYTIEPLPTNLSDLAESKIKFLLRFEDTVKPDDDRSNPIIEAQMFLSFFSLLIGSKLNIDSTMINDIKNEDPALYTDVYNEYKTQIEYIPDFSLLYKKFESMEYDIAKQLLRACDVYRSAVNLIETNTTLSFFLFCIAIECLSNKVSSKSGMQEKFADFILTYLPNKSDLNSEENWRKMLKEIYYNHRSGFTHGGKTIPDAVKMADKHDRIYVKNVIDGKEVLTPGLKWFERIVRNCLVGYLLNIELKNDDDYIDHFKDISLESNVVHLKIKKDMNAGRIVTENDVELD